jgi:hypothetical protein
VQAVSTSNGGRVLCSYIATNLAGSDGSWSIRSARILLTPGEPSAVVLWLSIWPVLPYRKWASGGHGINPLMLRRGLDCQEVLPQIVPYSKTKSRGFPLTNALLSQ